MASNGESATVNRTLEKSILVSGYVVDTNKNRIWTADYVYIVPDVNIDFLNLTNRAMNAIHSFYYNNPNNRFYRTGNDPIRLSDLLLLSEEELADIVNIGEKTRLQIVKTVYDFTQTNRILAALESDVYGNKTDDNEIPPKEERKSLAGDIKATTLIPGYIIYDNYVWTKDFKKAIHDISINDIEFLTTREIKSLRICLDKSYVWLADVLMISPYCFYNMHGTSESAAHELLNRLTEYLDVSMKPVAEVAEDAKYNSWNQPTIPDLTEDNSLGIMIAERGETRLFNNYVAVDGKIIDVEKKEVIQNSSIADMVDFSLRACEILRQLNIYDIYGVVKIPYDKLVNADHIGQKTFNEIYNKVEDYLLRQSLKIGMSDEEKVQEQIVEYLTSHPYEVNTKETLVQNIRDTDDSKIATALYVLERNGTVVCCDGNYDIKRQSFMDFLASASKDSPIKLTERTKDVLTRRMNDEILESIAIDYHLTRERVRQIEKKVFAKIKLLSFTFTEDKYAKLFQQYDIYKSFYISVGGYPLYCYLSKRYKNGTKTVNEAISDLTLPENIRRELESWNYQKYVVIDGERIFASRKCLVDFFVNKFTSENEMSIQDFISTYNRVLTQNGVTNERLYIRDKDISTIINCIANSKDVLWKNRKMFRYYNMQNRNFSALLDALSLEKYANRSVSTYTLFKQNQDIMRCYDIRDEYELHNLLRKLRVNEKIDWLEFKRMPTLYFKKRKKVNKKSA